MNSASEETKIIEYTVVPGEWYWHLPLDRPVMFLYKEGAHHGLFFVPTVDLAQEAKMVLNVLDIREMREIKISINTFLTHDS